MSDSDLYLRGLKPDAKRVLEKLARASGRSLNRYAVILLEEHADEAARKEKRGSK